jgi:hypothetical protein
MEKNSGGVEAARVIYQWGREGGWVSTDEALIQIIPDETFK